jgi:hypothetical protein
MLIIVIIGLMIVALMVYTSTRIKRMTREAFDAEEIATAEFSIRKPAGFLSVVEPKPPHVFDAYTRDFGADGAEDIRLATANVVVSDTSLEDAVASGDVIDDRREVIGETHYRVIESRSQEKGTDFLELRKVAELNGKAYTFTIKAIAETTDEFRRDIERMLDSFELK